MYFIVFYSRTPLVFRILDRGDGDAELALVATAQRARALVLILRLQQRSGVAHRKVVQGSWVGVRCPFHPSLFPVRAPHGVTPRSYVVRMPWLTLLPPPLYTCDRVTYAYIDRWRF